MTTFKLSEFAQEDMAKYFQGCLVRLITPDDKAKWLWYDGLNGEGQYVFRDSERKGSKGAKTILSQKDLKDFKIDVQFPVGYFNTETSVVWCQRYGQRAPNKGLYPEHNFKMLSIEDILQDSLAKSGIPERASLGLTLLAKKAKLTAELAQSMFEDREYWSVAESVLAIRKGKCFARALSGDIALAPHHAAKDFLVLFHDYPVAEFFSKTGKIKMIMEDFRAEVSEFFEPQGISVLT